MLETRDGTVPVQIGVSRVFNKEMFSKRRAQLALSKLLLYYLLFCPLVAISLYNTAIFHPLMCGDFKKGAIGGVAIKDVVFEGVAGRRIHGWFLKKPGARKVILVSHGNAGNLTHRASLAKLLLDSGSSVFMYDYGGYGLSTGVPSLDGICEDGLSAYDYLTGKLNVRAGDLVLYGESLGTGVSCHIAARRSCLALILQSGYMSIHHLAGVKLPLLRLYPRWLYPQNTLDNAAYVRGPHPPLLLIHGASDPVIPVTESRELFAAASQPRQLVEIKAGHNDIPDSELFAAVRPFLDKLQ